MKLSFFMPSLVLLGTFIVLPACRTPEANAEEKKAIASSAGCNANDIKVAINTNNHEFPKQMDKCASASWGDEEKSTKCLKIHYPALSRSCALCFGKMASCSASNCKAKCLFNHFSDGCLNCVSKYCRDKHKKSSFSLVECTGLAPDKLPPKK